MAETRSSSYINESIASSRTTTDHHANSLQEIAQQLNVNTQQLNVISLALQKLIEAKRRDNNHHLQRLHCLKLLSCHSLIWQRV